MKAKIRGLVSSLSLFALTIVPVNLVAADGLTRDDSGVLKKTETLNFKKADETDLMSSVEMIAIGLVTQRMYKYKPTPDILIAAAAGTAYIAGEVYSTLKYKDVAKEKNITVTTSSDGKQDDNQIESLKKEKELYDAAKDAAELKGKLQKAATAGFFAAGAASLVLKSSEMVALTGCETALTNASLTCPEISVTTEAARQSLHAHIIERETPKPSAEGAQTAKTARGVLLTQLTAAMTAAEGVATAEAATGVGAVKGAVCHEAAIAVSSCKAVPATFEHSESFGIVGVIGKDDSVENFLKSKKLFVVSEEKFNELVFTKIFKLIFPSAEASTVNLLSGGGGAVAGYLLGAFTSAGSIVDAQMLTPTKRAAMWATLGALSIHSYKTSEKVASDMNSNSNTINSVTKSMDASAKGIQISNTEFRAIDITKAIPKDNDVVIATDGAKISCITQDGDSGCKSSTGQITSLEQYNQMPLDLRNLGKSITTMGDALQGSNRITGATMGLVDSVGTKAIASKNYFDKNRTALNDFLKKNGKPVEDHKGMDGALLASIHSGIGKSLSDKGVTARDFMVGISTGGKDTVQPKDSEKSVVKSPLKTANIEKIQSATRKKENPMFTFNPLEVIGDDANSATLAKNDSKSKDEYEVGGAEIHKDNGTSLWTIITNRYIRNYSKFFEEDIKK